MASTERITRSICTSGISTMSLSQAAPMTSSGSCIGELRARTILPASER